MKEKIYKKNYGNEPEILVDDDPEAEESSDFDSKPPAPVIFNTVSNVSVIKDPVESAIIEKLQNNKQRIIKIHTYVANGSKYDVMYTYCDLKTGNQHTSRALV